MWISISTSTTTWNNRITIKATTTIKNLVLSLFPEKTRARGLELEQWETCLIFFFKLQKTEQNVDIICKSTNGYIRLNWLFFLPSCQCVSDLMITFSWAVFDKNIKTNSCQSQGKSQTKWRVLPQVDSLS